MKKKDKWKDSGLAQLQNCGVITVILITRHFSDATRFIKHSAPARRRGRWYPALNCECEAFSGLFNHYRDNHCNDHPSQDQTSPTQEMTLTAWLSSTRMVFILLLLQKSETTTCRPGDCTGNYQCNNHSGTNYSEVSLLSLKPNFCWIIIFSIGHE